MLRMWYAFGATALALAGLYAGNNPDTLGHLAQGRQIAELGHVPLLDTWSLLRGAHPWHNYEWLSDLLYYGLYSAFGYDGLIAFKCALLVGTALVLLTLARRFGGERAVIVATLFLVAALPAVRFRLSDRPHVIGICFAAVYFLTLVSLIDLDAQASRRRRWGHVALLGVMHLFWVNLHGSHLLGVAMTLAFALFSPRATRPLVLAALGLEAVASCISPYGPFIVIDAVRHVLDSRYRGIVSEWAPWDATVPLWLQLGPALQGALLALVAPRLFRVRASTRAALAVGLLLGVASFRSIRFVGEFMLLTVPLAGAGYASLTVKLSERRFEYSAAGALAILGCIVPWGASHLPPYLGIGHGLSYVDLPHAAGRLLSRARREPRVFAAVQHSWPLMWEAPRARFFIDGRVPFYGPTHVQKAIDSFHDDALFESNLRDDDIDVVILKHTMGSEQRRIASMQTHVGWSLVQIDDAFAMYARTDLAQLSAYPQFDALIPGYDIAWALGASVGQQAHIRREVTRLAAVPGANGYRHWVLALLELAPLARDAGHGGLRPAESESDWTRYHHAASLLRHVPELARDLPTVASLEALVLTILCDFAGADAALARSTSVIAEPGREGVLAGQELALRRGEHDRVRTFVEAGLRMPEGRDDPWLQGLQAELTHAPRCPPTP